MDRYSNPHWCSLWRNPPFRRQWNWIQGACWIGRTGRAEGKSLGEGENQKELAVCYTSSPQSFRVRNAEKNPVNVSCTQHKTSSIYWKTSEHLGQVQLAQITPHPSFVYIAISASRLILMFSSVSSDRYSIQSDCLTVTLLHTQETATATQLPSEGPLPWETHW